MTEDFDNAFEEVLDAPAEQEAALSAADEESYEVEDETGPSSQTGLQDASQDEDAQSAEPIQTSFGMVTGRLSEIADCMEDDQLSLDDALDLLEEAVALGMKASTMLDEDMAARDAAEEEAEEQADAEAAAEAAAETGAPASAYTTETAGSAFGAQPAADAEEGSIQ